ncbi:hypothetical protein CHL78_001315 [Romboutsia weinsteinii]|uniref:Uncharacterized protein n=1 Tax=Romboutsia weinsteinii TaxID=2020949 RepID=A0A371J9L0_9FIRM|nr:hypothetical protein [Romboutsia weinsteinii]RDY29366.1 hypothetical protein CHL78_001315 [Romboutsia weinsteinii]
MQAVAIKKINLKKSQVFFNAGIVFSILTPMIFMMYMYFQSINAGSNIYKLIFDNPITTIAFIIAMIQPFCALMVKTAVNDIKENKHKSLSQLVICTIAVIQIMVGNIAGSICLWIGIFKIDNKEKNIFKDFKKLLKNKEAKIRMVGCIFIVFVSLLCVFLKYSIKI